jgi:hypothetical protein
MSTTIILGPAAAAEAVCHQEQMQIWSHEIVVALGMNGYLRELDYGEVNEVHAVVESELRSIIEMAFDHPEARTILRKG